MNENIQGVIPEEERKEKIRKRYRVKNDRVRMIPAKDEGGGIFDDTQPERIAVYARVSTDSENQTSSYELQKNYYEEMVKRHPNWMLVDIYADEGISGTSLEHRESFMRMIDDCMDGKIDVIITKSVSRFARNIEDCIHYSRQLRFRTPPVGILFETENIFTLNKDSEMALSFIATMAQEESHSKSESMNRSYHMRFERGIFLTPTLLGYDHDEDGNLVVNEEEAKTVRLIFYMFLAGYTCTEIAVRLMELHRHTKVKKKSGEINWRWSRSSVIGILRNERYCGDVLAQKTYTPNYLNHRSVKNRNNLPQYYEEDHHEPIISRTDFIAAQKILDQAKYGFKNPLPELKVIDHGVLKGFVQMNPCWMGFSGEDYLKASLSVSSYGDCETQEFHLKRRKGEYDLENYQVVRSQFMPATNKIGVNISPRTLRFTSKAVQIFGDIEYVELLYHPLYNLLAVREGRKEDRHSVRWASFQKERYRPRHINGCAFLPALYELCGWNPEYKYTLTGYLKEQQGQRVLVFYADEPEIRVNQEEKQIIAYPKEWRDCFGELYPVNCAKDESVFHPDRVWNAGSSGIVGKGADFPMRSREEITADLEKLVSELMEDMEGRDEPGYQYG